MTDSRRSRAVASRFAAAAGTYDRSARVQLVAAAAVLAMAAGRTQPGRILEIGCGTGLLTGMLAVRFPLARIEAIDNAKGLVELAARKLAGNRNVRCRTENALELRDRAKYDLIVSSSAFHWMDCLNRLFYNLSRCLAPGGSVVFSMMLDGTLAELHKARVRVAPHKPPPVKLPDLPSVLTAVSDSGLKIIESREETARADYPSAGTLLRALHDLGVTAAQTAGPYTPMNRRELAALERDYDAHYSSGNRTGVFATYRILYAVCAKK